MYRLITVSCNFSCIYCDDLVNLLTERPYFKGWLVCLCGD